MSVKADGEALPATVWRDALSCADMLDRFPCRACGANRPVDCRTQLTPEQVKKTGEYINGYGWAAARSLAKGSAS